MGGESSARDTMGGILPLTPRAPEGPGSAAVVGGRVRTVRVDLVGPVVVLGEPVPVVAGLLRGRPGLPVQPLRLGARLLGPDLALARGGLALLDVALALLGAPAHLLGLGPGLLHATAALRGPRHGEDHEEHEHGADHDQPDVVHGGSVPFGCGHASPAAPAPPPLGPRVAQASGSRTFSSRVYSCSPWRSRTSAPASLSCRRSSRARAWSFSARAAARATRGSVIGCGGWSRPSTHVRSAPSRGCPRPDHG